jgi:hypothetical protein
MPECEQERGGGKLERCTHTYELHDTLERLMQLRSQLDERKSVSSERLYLIPHDDGLGQGLAKIR